MNVAIVLKEPVPVTSKSLPPFVPGEPTHEWVNLNGSAVPNISHPNFREIHTRRLLDDRNWYRDCWITAVYEQGNDWRVEFDMSQYGSLPNVVVVDKAIGVTPKVNNKIRIYVDNPSMFQHARQIGVGIEDRVLLF